MLHAHGPVHEQIDSLSTLIESYPDSIVLYMERGLYYKVDEDWRNAESDFLHVLTVQEKTYSLYYELADVYYQQKKWLLANQYIKKHLFHYPKHADAYTCSGKIYTQLNLPALALSDYQSALAIKGQKAKVEDYLYLADAHKENNPQESIKTLTAAIQSLGDLRTLQIPLVDLYVTNGQYEQALNLVEKIISSSNRKEQWLLKKAEICEMDNRCVMAHKTYQNCLNEIQGLKQKTKETEVVKNIKQKAIAALKYF